MGDRSSEAVAYLPASLVRAVAGQRKRGLPWHQEVDGTMVMADLSGFTALSERLARLGNEGAERLTLIINSFFERMLKTASRYGGDTLTFGGDAILLLFDGPEHAARAAVAALEMLRQVDRAAGVQTDDGKVKIGMSVGAHSDRFLLAGVGVADERAHLFVPGRGAEQTALAEAQAERGQLAVSGACRELLPDGSLVEPAGEYWWVEECGAGALPRLRAEAHSLSAAQLDDLNPFLPPYVRAKEEGDAVRLPPEHRRAAIAFVNVLGLNGVVTRDGVAAAVDQLQMYVAMLTRLASKHQGFVVSSDIATLGSKLVVTFGAPVAHEHAPTNAARFALDLRSELRESGLDLTHKIGVNSGHVFAGEVGPSFRRQYTVMGDSVNLAARLMGAATLGEALASRHLLSHVSQDLCARKLPPISVKGKEEPVAVCVLEEEGVTSSQIHGAEGQRRRHSRLFGRREELELLNQRWNTARRGEGGAALIEGEPGIGKTRLLDEALRSLRTGGGRVLRAACLEHLQAAPFTPWIDVLSEAMALPKAESIERRTEVAKDVLDQRLPELMELGALLNPLLVLSLPESEVVRSLEGDLRRQRLFDLIAGILTGIAGDQGLVVVLEDLHWADESTLALTRDLAQRAQRGRLLLLLTARPADPPVDLADVGVESIVVSELTEGQSIEMVSEALDLQTLPHEVGEAIFHKTRGNPLFLEEVVHALRASGAVDRILAASTVARAAELAALEIPDRVQGLLMSRIDQLSAGAREVLKAGAVVGRSFDPGLLSAIEDDFLCGVGIDDSIDELLGSGLVVPEAGMAALTFRHALVQDVAYESLPFARRRDLHGRVARHLERAMVGAPDHGLLVHHYSRAGDHAQTGLHAVKAAQASVAVFANAEAVDYLAIALRTTTGRTAHDACLRSRIEELMGDSMFTLARHDEAIDSFTRARRRWASPSVRAAADDALRDVSPVEKADERAALLCWKLAVAAEKARSDYRRTLRWLDMGAEALPSRRGDTMARILVTRGLALSRLGRYVKAVEAGKQGVELAREGGDVALQAYALNTLGTVLSTQGTLREAIDCSTRAIELYERAGDLYGQAMSHGNVGADYVVAGDLRSALGHHQRSLELHSRLGNVTGIAFQHMNIGGALSQMGELDDAVAHLNEAIRLGEHGGVSRLGTGFSYLMLARSWLWSGDVDRAERDLNEAIMILESIDAQSFLLDAGVITAELLLVKGQLQQAESTCRTVVEKARRMSAELSEAEASSMLGRILLANGSPEAAIPVLERSMALAEEDGSDYERAKALALLAEAEHACGAGEASCEDKLGEAIRMFEEMSARHDLEQALERRALRRVRTEGVS